MNIVPQTVTADAIVIKHAEAVELRAALDDAIFALDAEESTALGPLVRLRDKLREAGR